MEGRYKLKKKNHFGKSVRVTCTETGVLTALHLMKDREEGLHKSLAPYRKSSVAISHDHDIQL